MSLLAPGATVARYTILGRLATGGMSEVYLARQAGPAGFSKILVLKVILPQLADDPQFVQMFENEAKLAALINHPNVVQIFDFGVENGLHYMAMEFIDGRNLNRILRTLQKAKQPLPVPVALRIVSDAAGALDFAHTLADPEGLPLQIIHRDVSLENILVTYTGQIKLVDFGIAKARTLESYTTHGTLKGKYNYMAPELIEARPIDHRIDIYALGVVLYRLLTGQMPFTGENHAQILHRIINTPATSLCELRPDLDVDLERIALRTLAKDRDVRYQRAFELQAELEAYLQRLGSAVMPYQLAQFMGRLFPPGTDEDRDRYQQLAGVSTPHASAARSRSGQGGGLTPATQSTPSGSGRQISTPSVTGPRQAPRSEPPTMERTGPPPPATRPLAPSPPTLTAPSGSNPKITAVAAVEDLGALPAVEGPLSRRDTDRTQIYGGPDLGPPPAEMPAPALSPPPSRRGGKERTATAQLQGRPDLERQPIPRLLLAVVAVALVAAFAALGYWLLRRDRVPVTVPEIPTGRVDAHAVTPPAPDAQLSSPDQRQAPPPVDAAPRADRPAAKKPRLPVVRPPRRGSLSLQSLAPAEVYVDGRRVGSVPLRHLALPPGTHRLSVRSARHHYEISRSIVVKADRDLQLTLTPRQGRIRVLVRPWAVVTLDGRRLGTTPLPAASAYEGPHTVELENSKLKVKRTLKVQLRAGEEELVKVYLD